jgi:glutamine phosphoribosylpyrophosphate amidotransferase
VCEQYVAVADTPFRIGDLWGLTDRLEHWGIAGFGWGATWLADDGTLRSHRDTGTFRDDPGRDEVGRQETTAIVVHLRRPSKLSTIGPADTQPFDDPAGRYSFSHNGDLPNYLRFRERYREQGRIHGRADTEVGARWLEDAWRDDVPPTQLLLELHDTFGGHANLAVLTREGDAYHYAGNDENPVFAFRLGDVRIASTGLYSLDRSIFRYAAPEATERRLVPLGETAILRRAAVPA